MKWNKKGLICSHKTFDLTWYKKNTMVPVPYLLDDNTLRIFLTFCDEKNIGRIGFVDVNPENPSEILDFSKEPVIDIGSDGCFDDNGVITASVLKDNDELLLYYSGYQLGVKVPYTIFSGLAISEDNGHSFVKYSNTPILDRINDERSSRAAPIVLKDNNKYKMWYTGDYKSGWIKNEAGKSLPYYYIKYIESSSPKEWKDKEGINCLEFLNEDEHGLAKPCIWKEDSKYKMIYSIRTLSKAYRLGYAESNDGIKFVRMDDEVGIDVSGTGWDSEMICFGSRFEYKDKVYLFYCGNKYGLDGFGYAELIKK